VKAELWRKSRLARSFVGRSMVSDMMPVVAHHTLTRLVARCCNIQRPFAYCVITFLIAMGVYFFFFKKVQLATDGGGRRSGCRKRDWQGFASGFLIIRSSRRHPFRLGK